MESQKDTSFNWKAIKESKKIPAITDHILLKGHDASFEDFTILLKESNKFEIHRNESLSINRDDPELKRTIFCNPLELFH